MTESEKHLIEIARCDNFLNCKGTSCEKIVDYQQQTNKQLPEPWNGNIVNSKILFISSNPSINENEFYPLINWIDNDIIDYFNNRFSESRDYVKKFLYPKYKKGYSDNWVRYWAYIRSISKSLLGKENVVPGIDYSMMEIVRCKSHNEYGVLEAQDVCVKKYLNKTISLSKAKVIVAVGDKSRGVLQEKFKVNLINNPYEKTTIGNIERMILAIPHSNSRKKRSLDVIMDQDSINRIQNYLK